jgi:hypothetical protein
MAGTLPIQGIQPAVLTPISQQQRPRPSLGSSGSLVLQAPAPVVAKTLGYSQQQTACLVAEAGGTWTRYADGDHTRLQDRRTPDR